MLFQPRPFRGEPVRGVLAAALALIVLVGAGCGAAGAKKSVVISRGDAICRRADSMLLAQPGHSKADFGPYASARELKAFAADNRRYADILQQELHELRRLPQPSADALTLGRAMKALDGEIAVMRREATAAASSHRRRAVSLELHRERLAGEFGAEAARFGFQECASGGI